MRRLASHQPCKAVVEKHPLVVLELYTHAILSNLATLYQQVQCGDAHEKDAVLNSAK